MYKNIKAIVYGGLLMAMVILLTYVFVIQTQFMRISLAFIPLAIYAYLYGRYNCMIIAILADIIGVNMFMPGMYFPGFTISAAISGYIYGYFLHREHPKLKHCFYAFITVFFLVDCICNNLWLYLMYHDAAKVFVPIRIVKALLMVPIKSYIIYKLISILKDRVHLNIAR